MKKLSFLFAIFLLAGCVGEEKLMVSEMEDVASEEASSTIKESEFIKAAIEYVNELIPVVDELTMELEYPEQIEDESWRLSMESLGLSLYMQDTSLFLATNDLSVDQEEKYDSTIKQYEITNALIAEINKGITSANSTYDKRKYVEIKKQLPILKKELISMKDQVEFERYK